jgi:hypothetical protein
MKFRTNMSRRPPKRERSRIESSPEEGGESLRVGEVSVDEANTCNIM